MNALPLEPPSPERQQALLTLLADDDPAVSGAIRAQLLANLGTHRAWLGRQRAHPDPAVRRALRALLHGVEAAEADGRFLSFVLGQGEHLDLETAVWMWVRTRFPDCPVAGYQAQLDAWAGEAREMLPADGTAIHALAALHRQMFERLEFRGNAENYFDPENSYANRVMDRRTGIPIALCAVYLFLARRLRLPVTGIGMPGHFLCRYQSAREEHYIDVFHRGQLLTRADCLRRLRHFAGEVDESALLPISSRRILQRMISNVQLIHKERKERAEAERLQRYLIALAR